MGSCRQDYCVCQGHKPVFYQCPVGQVLCSHWYSVCLSRRTLVVALLNSQLPDPCHVRLPQFRWWSIFWMNFVFVGCFSLFVDFVIQMIMFIWILQLASVNTMVLVMSWVRVVKTTACARARNRCSTSALLVRCLCSHWASVWPQPPTHVVVLNNPLSDLCHVSDC